MKEKGASLGMCMKALRQKLSINGAMRTRQSDIGLNDMDGAVKEDTTVI